MKNLVYSEFKTEDAKENILQAYCEYWPCTGIQPTHCIVSNVDGLDDGGAEIESMTIIYNSTIPKNAVILYQEEVSPFPIRVANFSDVEKPKEADRYANRSPDQEENHVVITGIVPGKEITDANPSPQRELGSK